MNHGKIGTGDLERAFSHLHKSVQDTILARSNYSFTSPTHAFGNITKEYYDLTAALRKGKITEMHDELLDLATTTIWAVASLLAYWE